MKYAMLSIVISWVIALMRRYLLLDDPFSILGVKLTAIEWYSAALAIVLGLIGIIRPIRTWLFDELWTLRFFIREKIRACRISKQEKPPRRELPMKKPSKDYGRPRDKERMWGLTEMQHLFQKNGFYDEATDAMLDFPEDTNPGTPFDEFYTWGLYGESPGREGPAHAEYVAKRHAENLARVESENQNKYNQHRMSAGNELESASEARKIVRCKELLDNLPNLSWNRDFEPEGRAEMYRKELVKYLKSELKRARRVRSGGGS